MRAVWYALMAVVLAVVWLGPGAAVFVCGWFGDRSVVGIAGSVAVGLVVAVVLVARRLDARAARGEARFARALAATVALLGAAAAVAVVVAVWITVRVAASAALGRLPATTPFLMVGIPVQAFAALVMLSRAVRVKHVEVAPRGEPILQGDALLAAIRTALGGAGFARVGVTHGAHCVSHGGGRVEIGVALLAHADRETLGLLVAFARQRARSWVARALVRASSVAQAWAWQCSTDFLLTPMAPLYWAPQSLSRALGAASALMQLDVEEQARAALGARVLDGAVAAQIEDAHATLRRIWTAVHAARARRRVDDLYVLEPDPNLAGIVPPAEDVARLADGHAFHVRHPAPARAQGEPAVPRALLAPYQALFTARIVYHSTFEVQLHAAALGLGPIPREPP